MGASTGPELLSIGGVTSATAGTRKLPTSILRRPFRTHNYQRLNSRARPQTGTMSQRSSQHRTGSTGARLSEPTGGTGVRIKTPALTDKFATASRRNLSAARGDNNPRPFKITLKLCKSVLAIRVPRLPTFSPVLCLPFCISDRDIFG